MEAPGGDVGEVQRRRARAADAGGARRQRPQRRQVGVEAGLVAVREAGRQQRVVQARRVAGADAAVVQVGAAAGLGGEQLLLDRVEHHAELQPTAPAQGDRHRVVRHAEQEVGSAVERVDQPLELGLRVRFRRALLGADGVLRVGAAQPLRDRPFGLAVGAADEVVRALALDLQAVGEVVVADDDAPGRPGGVDGDVQQGAHGSDRDGDCPGGGTRRRAFAPKAILDRNSQV